MFANLKIDKKTLLDPENPNPVEEKSRTASKCCLIFICVILISAAIFVYFSPVTGASASDQEFLFDDSQNQEVKSISDPFGTFGKINQPVSHYYKYNAEMRNYEEISSSEFSNIYVGKLQSSNLDFVHSQIMDALLNMKNSNIKVFEFNPETSQYEEKAPAKESKFTDTAQSALENLDNELSSNADSQLPSIYDYNFSETGFRK